jgi:hypothetical protein
VSDQPVQPSRSQPGRRGNGLSAAAYALLTDVDPHVAGDLLAALRAAGVAAYAQPGDGPPDAGSFGEGQPRRAASGLYVDASRRAAAASVVAAALDDARDAAFREIVAHYDAPGGEPVWPAAEDGDGPAWPRAVVVRPASGAPPSGQPPQGEPAEEEHWEPPPPPPAPRLAQVTRWALVGLGFGLLLLFGPTLIGIEHSTAVDTVAVVVITASTVVLVSRLRRGPPADDGWDDGAVV